MTASIIIVTLNRPDCVQVCLERIALQEPEPHQVIVVDASSDNRTELAAHQFPSVEYVRTDSGYGHMTASRNLGLRHATGDIVAFLDDDAYARPGWLASLIAPYADPTVGAVGGRALNNQPNEATRGVDEVGLLKRDGTLTGNFAADPGCIIAVDHIVGCNMSFRRSILAELGGLREDYPGTEVREETDICLRVKRLGYRILFNPAACVDHIGAPQVKGQRFDLRYAYYAQRNHLVLLARNFGPFAPIVRRYLASSSLSAAGELIRRVAAALARFGVTMMGTLLGITSAVVLLARTGRDPVRRDPDAVAIRAALAKRTSAPPAGSDREAGRPADTARA